MVALSGADNRPDRDHRCRLGSPAWSSACRGGVLRLHRPADLASLVDPSLGVGGAPAGGTDRDGVAAALTLVRPRRSGCRHHFLDIISIPSPGRQPSPARLLAGDIYVLCGLALLMGTALVLARECASTAPRLAHQPGGRSHDGSGKPPGLRRPAWPSRSNCFLRHLR